MQLKTVTFQPETFNIELFFMDLKNKIAVITGVSKGIGNALTEQLLEKGTVVAGWGNNKPDIIHKDFHFFKTDIQIGRAHV